MLIFDVQISDSAASEIRKLQSGSDTEKLNWFLRQFTILNRNRDCLDAGDLDDDSYNDRLAQLIEEVAVAADLWGDDSPAVQELRQRYAEADKLLDGVE